MKIFTVYCWTGKNMKRYVGITSQGVSKRFVKHLLYSRKNPSGFFHKALAKYGADFFELSILNTGLNAAQAAMAETQWIETLNTLSPNGYNLVTGSESNRSNKIRISPETRQKLSDLNKKRMQDPARRQQLRDANKAYWKTERSKKEQSEKLKKQWLDPVFREKIILVSKQKKTIKNEAYFKKSKKIMCVETGKEYSSIREARKETGFTSINTVVRGIGKTAGGFHWRLI